MTPEMVLALGTLLGVLFNGLATLRNGRKADRVAAKVDENTGMTEVVHQKVNGGITALLDEVVILRAELIRLKKGGK